MKQIVIKNLSVGYDKKVVLPNLNLTINQGDYLCIYGENGAGKSTLLKTILGLLPPIDGEIVWESLSRNEVGYLPQQTVVQKDFPASVTEVVMSGFVHKHKLGFYSKAEKQIALEKLKELGIENLSKACYRELSGGQQQRVLLARALCGTDKMLLLDEPVAGLDPLATQEMYKIIQQLNKGGVTIIMITHDVGCTLKFASHILFASPTPFYGTVAEFKENQFSKNHYVGGHIGGHNEHI